MYSFKPRILLGFFITEKFQIELFSPKRYNLDMSSKQITNLSVWGGVFVVIFGSILHFTYTWSGNNFIVGLFAPVNESPWEHMKQLFTPLILFALIEYPLLKNKVENYCFTLFAEIILAIAFILVVFYAYTYLAGHSILVIDIGSFVAAIILAKYVGYKILINKNYRNLNVISIILLTTLTLFFFYATLNPPHIDLFLDSVTNNYGINKAK